MTDPSLLPNRTHFPGLNALRFYAALAVIFWHIDFNIEPRPFLFKVIKPLLISAGSAVDLFFVLSGFLITYLLLREFDITGKVDVGRFYIRRALRIWPAYYFVAIVGFLIFPLFFGLEYFSTLFYSEGISTIAPVTGRLILVFCLLPNFASISGPMAHLWTIGVEEQFYALWPWVVRNKLSIPRISLGILIVKFILNPILPLFNINGMTILFNSLRFECMAIGALGAYVYCEGFPRLMNWVYHPFAQLLVLAGCFYIAGRENENVYTTTIKSIFFIVIILNIGTNPRPLVRLNHSLLERLGRVSYGMYLYHFLILYVFIKGMPRFILFRESPFSPTIAFIGAIGCTWLIAELSYRWLEKPFLDLKKRFSVIRD